MIDFGFVHVTPSNGLDVLVRSAWAAKHQGPQHITLFGQLWSSQITFVSHILFHYDSGNIYPKLTTEAWASHHFQSFGISEHLHCLG